MRESDSLYEVLKQLINNDLANLHTTIVAKVTAVNATTIDCQPVINRMVDAEEQPLPVFPEIPPIFMQGGGSYTAHPIAVGDYCLLVISERCFDSWYAGNDFTQPIDKRMHDYSDAFALVGVNPAAKAITIPSTIEQTGDSVYNGDQTIHGDMVINGNLNVSQTITCNRLVVNGIEFGTHKHPENNSVTSGPIN